MIQFSKPQDNMPLPAGFNLEMDDDFVVLYLGNAGFGHSFETVLDAAKLLDDKPITFLFVGGGEKWPSLQDHKEAMGLERFRLRPYVPKEATPSIMSLADCALITLNESALGVISPSKLHSNLAMSLPIIYVGPEGGNVDDAIKRFTCGSSIRHGDSQKIVRFIDKLRADRAVLQEYRLNARRAFEEAYNDRVTLPKFDEILESLAPLGG